MRINNFLKCMMIVLFFGISAAPAMAQKNIDKLLEEIEKREDVSVNSVVKRDPKTRKITSTIKSFSLTDEKMAKRLIDAFEKDEEYTITAIKDMPRGRKGTAQANFTFIFQKDNEKRTYTFNATPSGRINVSVIIKESKQSDIDTSDFSFHFDKTFNDLDIKMSNKQKEKWKEESIKKYEQSIKKHQELIKKHQESLKAKNISQLQVSPNSQFR